MNYFSIRISIICLVDESQIPEDGYTQDIQIYIVKAGDFDEAFKKAIEIGKSEEQDYINEFGNKVKWVFKEVEAITRLGDSVLGIEISSRMEGFNPENPIAYETPFRPEKSDPILKDEENV